MTAPVRAGDLHGAAYKAAYAKACRGGFTPPPPTPVVVPGIPLGDMEPADYEAMVAARPKRITDMDATEYADARRAVIRAAA